MENYPKEEISFLAHFVSQFYGEPEVRKVTKPSEKKIIKQEVIEYQEKEKKVPYKGSNYVPGILLGVASVVGAAVIGQTGLSTVAIPILIIGLVIAAILALTIKGTKFKTETEKVPVKKMIDQEVLGEPQIIEEKIPNHIKVTGFHRGTINFAVESLLGHALLLLKEDSSYNTSLNYPVLKNTSKVLKAYREMEQELESIPFVLQGEKETYKVGEISEYGDKITLRGFEKKLMDYFFEIHEEFPNIQRKPINLPVVTDNNITTYLKVREGNGRSNDLQDCQTLFTSNEGIHMDEFSANWLEDWESREKALNRARIHSLHDEVKIEFFQLGQTTHYSGFNFYCPHCAKEISEDLLQRDYSVAKNTDYEEVYFSKNSRCEYDPQAGLWKCPQCREIISNPIPVHKSYDEILLPVYDNLMEENKIEREKNHSEIRKREMEIRNEMKKDIDEVDYQNLSGIYILQEEMDRMRAEIEGETDAITDMRRIAEDFKAIQSEIIQEVQRQNNFIKSEIEERKIKIIAEIDNYKNTRLASYEQNMDQLSKADRREEMERDKVFRDVLNETKKQSEIQREGFDKVRGAVNINTAASVAGFERMGQNQQKANKLLANSNAMNAARAKREGIVYTEEELRKGHLRNEELMSKYL